MIADKHKQTQAALVALVEYEEAYDSAKFALEEALPNSNQAVINELLSSLIELVLCSIKHQTMNGYENESSSN